MKNKTLVIILVLITIIFIIGLFKNIAFPLLWNDEAETTMFATRILEYGYPKVHDGKNVVCALGPNIKDAVNKNLDAWVGSPWGQYYFATIGTLLAKGTENIYTKTALLRIPFVLIGLLGLGIIALSVLSLFHKKPRAKLIFLILFLLFETLSIPLILHLRQVRYYPLALFLSGTILYLYINYKFSRKSPCNDNRKGIFACPYIILMSLLLILCFNTFPPLCLAFIITLGLYECSDFLKKKVLKEFIINCLPLLISLISAVLLLKFFKILEIQKVFATTLNFNLAEQYKHILEVIAFFQRYEFLSLVLFIKIVLGILWVSIPKNENKNSLRTNFSISNILSLFFVIYILVVTRSALRLVYQRYFIMSQPILILILLLDIFIIFELLSHVRPTIFKRSVTISILLIACSFFAVTLFNKAAHIKNYIYELSHQYKGPLDYIIPYIKSNYKNPQDLIIATNYEECAYMYYLGSKVTIGFVGNNLQEDLKIQPDIVIFRKRWTNYTDPKIFYGFLNNEIYKKIVFPIYDNPVNNIPQIDSGPLSHLYKTRFTQRASHRLEIYVR